MYAVTGTGTKLCFGGWEPLALQHHSASAAVSWQIMTFCLWYSIHSASPPCQAPVMTDIRKQGVATGGHLFCCSAINSASPLSRHQKLGGFYWKMCSRLIVNCDLLGAEPHVCQPPTFLEGINIFTITWLLEGDRIMCLPPLNFWGASHLLQLSCHNSQA